MFVGYVDRPKKNNLLDKLKGSKERAEAKLQSFNARNASVMAARKARNDAEAKVDELSLVVQDLQERPRKDC